MLQCYMDNKNSTTFPTS